MVKMFFTATLHPGRGDMAGGVVMASPGGSDHGAGLPSAAVAARGGGTALLPVFVVWGGFFLPAALAGRELFCPGRVTTLIGPRRRRSSR